MATKSLFEVETALADWRAGLSSLSADDVAELENHLLESVAELRRTGLAEDEAFAIAVQRLGDARELLDSLGGGVPVEVAAPEVSRPWWRRGARLAGVLAFCGAAVVLVKLATSPKLYQGRVLMEIHRSSQMNHAFRLEEPPDESRSFIANQLAVITAKETLFFVVNKLDLASSWGLASDDEACAKLSSRLRVGRIDDTDMVSIIVLSPEPEEAAKLANEAATAYMRRRSDLDRSKTDLLFQTLVRTSEGQEVAVRQAFDRLQSFIKEHHIVDLSEEMIGRRALPRLLTLRPPKSSKARLRSWRLTDSSWNCSRTSRGVSFSKRRSRSRCWMRLLSASASSILAISSKWRKRGFQALGRAIPRCSGRRSRQKNGSNNWKRAFRMCGKIWRTGSPRPRRYWITSRSWPRIRPAPSSKPRKTCGSIINSNGLTFFKRRFWTK